MKILTFTEFNRLSESERPQKNKDKKGELKGKINMLEFKIKKFKKSGSPTSKMENILKKLKAELANM